MTQLAEYIVVMPRIEGNMTYGFSTRFYTDGERRKSLAAIKRHGMHTLDKSDDFLIGLVEGDRLVSLQWMDDVRDDADELCDAARDLGLETAES